MRCWKTVAAFLGMALHISSAHAEEWSTTMKLTNGQCGGDGLVVKVRESSGLLQTTAVVNNKAVTREVKLAPDGSGTLTYTSDFFGDMKVEVPAGVGKREFRQSQVKGICIWTFKPN